MLGFQLFPPSPPHLPTLPHLLLDCFEHPGEVEASFGCGFAVDAKALCFEDFDDIGFFVEIGAGGFTRTREETTDLFEQTKTRGFGCETDN
jgi:hypothetical protein